MPSTMHTIDAGFPKFTGTESTEDKVNAIQNYLFMLQEELHYVLHNLGSENINDNSLKELKRDIAGSVTVDAASIRGKLTAAQIDVGDLRISKLWLPRGTNGGYDVAISAELGDGHAYGEINIGKGDTIFGAFDSVNIYADKTNIGKPNFGTLRIQPGSMGKLYPSAGIWDIGTEEKPFRNVYASNIVTAWGLRPSDETVSIIGSPNERWYGAWIDNITVTYGIWFREQGRAELAHDNTHNRINVKHAAAFCGEVTGSAGSYSYPTLGSADLPWIDIYGGKIILGFSTSTTLELTCDANGKLCVNGTPIH